MELWHGRGGVHHPSTRILDAAVSARLKAMGFATARHGDGCLYASTSMEHAMDYAGGYGGVFAVRPLEGATLMFAEGTHDLALSFETWLRRQADAAVGARCVRSRFLLDVRGDVGILETYLSHGRMGRVVAELVDGFLATRRMEEARVGPDFDLAAFLGSHEGEVVINGPVAIEPAAPPPRP